MKVLTEQHALDVDKIKKIEDQNIEKENELVALRERMENYEKGGIFYTILHIIY